MYELGFAHGAKRPTILLTSNTSALPFDLAGVRTLIYDPSASGLRALQDNLQQSLTQAAKSPEFFLYASAARARRGQEHICEL